MGNFLFLIPPILCKRVRIKNQPPNVDPSAEKLRLDKALSLCRLLRSLSILNMFQAQRKSYLRKYFFFLRLFRFNAISVTRVSTVVSIPLIFSYRLSEKLYNDWAMWMTVSMNGGEFRDTNWNGRLASRLWAWGADSLGTGRKVGVNQRTRRCDCGAHVHSCVD